MENKKEKPLTFDSVGDEYIFLYEEIQKSDFAGMLTNETESPTIESLRKIYKEIVKNNSLDKKYEGSKRYWFLEQEEAVKNYIATDDPIKRNLIFSQHLYKSMNKLIENIIFTYKLFRKDIHIKELQADCMSFLITKIEKFNPNSGTQAFSYLGTIAKHYLMGGVREAYKGTKTNLDIDDNLEEASNIPDNIYIIDDEKDVDINSLVFEEIIKKLEQDIKKPKMLPNDRRVAEAIILIFKTHYIHEAYNKNKLYFHLKDITGLQTKDITYSLGRLKKDYELFKIDFLYRRNK